MISLQTVSLYCASASASAADNGESPARAGQQNSNGRHSRAPLSFKHSRVFSAPHEIRRAHTALLQDCAKLGLLPRAKMAHAAVIKSGVEPDTFMLNTLVNMYAKCKEIEDARQVFDRMTHKDVVSWNVIITACVQSGQCLEALQLFCRMREIEVRFSEFTLSVVIRACAGSQALELGLQVHSLVTKCGYQKDPVIENCLLDMYAKCGFVQEAAKVFDRMLQPDVVSWSNMISGYEQQGYNEDAILTFNLMKLENIWPNNFTFTSVLSAAGKLGDVKQGKALHACAIKHGWSSDVIVENSVIGMYIGSRSMADANKTFWKMTERDNLSWNTMISGFSQRLEGEEAMKLFCLMQNAGVRPNKFTFHSILNGCAEHLTWVEQIHALILKIGLESDPFIKNALFSAYSEHVCTENACHALQKMFETDLFSWTAAISKSTQNGFWERSFRIFQEMQRSGTRANEFTFSAVLKACTSITALEQGRQIHVNLIKTAFEGNLFAGSALVDMYAKSGAIEDAIKVFDIIPEKDLILYNTMIAGYAQHGLEKEAIRLFKQMQDAYVEPDHLTFVGVLSACSHTGFVDEGYRIFHSLRDIHGMEPTMDHYAGMVDLLGRAGRVEEAEDFINKMPLEPNVLVWQTLLGACRMHGNLNVALRAANRITDLDPQNDSAYVLLSNIYAAAGRWKDVERVRKLMLDAGVKKEPGCSWIEIQNQVHVFLSEDTSHPQTKEIYTRLNELTKEMVKAGYDLRGKYSYGSAQGENRPRKSSIYHSERLAISLGLLKSPMSKPLRIFKNLRVCEDCHSALKLISKLTSREIVVRDANRYHRFKDGSCSCGDFW